MNQDTINGIRAYAGLYWDLRRILDNCNHPLDPDSLNELEARLRALNGIVEAIKADPDKEGIRIMLKRWGGRGWPEMLGLSSKAKERLEDGVLLWSSLPQQALEQRVEAFKVLLTKLNRITRRIAGAVGIAVPIDPVELAGLFYSDFVESNKWQECIDRLEDFKKGNPGKRDVAILAHYIKSSKFSVGDTGADGWKEWYNSFCNTLGVEAGTYKHSQIGVYIDTEYDHYMQIVMPFMPILPR